MKRTLSDAARDDFMSWMWSEEMTLSITHRPRTPREVAKLLAEAVLEIATIRLRACGLSAEEVAALTAEAYARRAGVIR